MTAADDGVDVVVVRSAKHLAVGIPRWIRQCIAGVSAVPGHRQTVLIHLITDGERRVFSRVPQTSSMLNLLAVTRK